MDLLYDTLRKVKNAIIDVTHADVNDEAYIIKQINKWKTSKDRNDMIVGEKYYIGLHDILNRKRTAIGENGELEEIENLPNHRIVDNQYKKMVDQKVNYLIGKPITIQTQDDNYNHILSKIYNRKFLKVFRNIGEDSYNCGIGFMYVYIDEHGEFSVKRFRPYEFIPCWKDDDHTILEYGIRIYNVIEQGANKDTLKERVEVYSANGVDYFELKNGMLYSIEPKHTDYIKINDVGYNWSQIPIIAFKYNSKEIPLIKYVKSLQDGINLIESNFQNNMEEDARNTILVLVNYDGEKLGEFRRNLATYGAVKVKNTKDYPSGDVKTLQVEVNAENYKAILNLFKVALIENAMGYDAKNDKLGSNPNQMNIQSMYNDIDMDANGTETEYQMALEQLNWFVNCHIYNTGLGDYFDEKVDFIFNRDTLINETEVISNCIKLEGLLSKKTIIAQIPWVTDVNQELELLEEERGEDNPFGEIEDELLDEESGNTRKANIPGSEEKV